VRSAAATVAAVSGPALSGPLTAATVAAMDEATLRRRVLIPLCEALGWQDVREGHGTTERGKDIVAWVPDHAGARTGCAVVAKATPIDGRADITNRSAGGVFNQVVQCFGTPYRDRADGKAYPVGKCLVITNQPITQQATDAFWDMMLGTVHADKVELIDGQRLWSLARQHLPQAFVGRIADARAAAEAFADPHYRLEFTSDATGTTIGIRERYEGAFEDRPLTIEIADEAGAAEAIAAQSRAIEEDTAVTIEGAAARAVRLPEEFRHLLPSDEFASVTIDLPERLAHHSAELRLDDGTGSPLIIGPLAVDLHQIAGTRARYTNRHQLAPPLRFRYDADLAAAPDGGVILTTGTFHYGPGTWNVEDRRSVARLNAMLQRPCALRLIDRATRQILVDAQLPAKPPTPGLHAILLLFDGLVKLQERTGVPIAIPDPLGEVDLATLRKLATIALTGSLRETWDGFAMTVPTSAIAPEALTTLLAGVDTSLGLTGQSEEQIGGATIPLGTQRVTLVSVRLVNIGEVREAIAAEASLVTLQLVPGDDATVVRYFPDWQPETRKQGDDVRR
jgi:hypothetical protein